MIVKDNTLNLNYDLTETKSYKTMPHYNYWRGWWNENPRNTVEEVIKLLWQDYIDPTDYTLGGFEYWSRIINRGGSLEWHQDTGEYYYFDNNYWISDQSLLYYPKVTNDCVGGFLEIAPYKNRKSLEDSQKAARCIDNNDIERIKSVQDRMVLMDSAQLHRVSNVYQGTRYNLATALWKQTPDFFAEHENWNIGNISNISKPQLDLQKIDWKDKNETIIDKKNKTDKNLIC